MTISLESFNLIQTSKNVKFICEIHIHIVTISNAQNVYE